MKICTEQWLLLRAALLTDDAAVHAWREWRAAAGDDAGTRGADLLPLVAHNLRRLDVSDPLLEASRDVERSVWLTNVFRMAELGKLLRRLAERDVPTLVLKGAALITQYYPDPGLRAMYDVDVLVPRASAPAAIRALREAGWWPVGLREQPSAPERSFDVRHAQPFAGPGGERLDLHWHVLWECCEPDADADFWTRSVATRVGGVETRALDPTDQLFHVCVHGSRWNGASPLRWAADAMHVLAVAGAEIDWDRLVVQARRRGLVLPVREALRRLVACLDAVVPAPALGALARERTSLLHRIEQRARSRGRARWVVPVLMACHHWRLSRSRGLPRTVVGFPRYLQQTYELDRLADLVPLVAEKVWRRRP